MIQINKKNIKACVAILLAVVAFSTSAHAAECEQDENKVCVCTTQHGQYFEKYIDEKAAYGVFDEYPNEGVEPLRLTYPGAEYVEHETTYIIELRIEG